VNQMPSQEDGDLYIICSDAVMAEFDDVCSRKKSVATLEARISSLLFFTRCRLCSATPSSSHTPTRLKVDQETRGPTRSPSCRKRRVSERHTRQSVAFATLPLLRVLYGLLYCLFRFTAITFSLQRPSTSSSFIRNCMLSVTQLRVRRPTPMPFFARITR
jgi:hypothetical protein